MLVVVVFANIIFAFLPLRFDVTEAQIFSVSDVTKDTLKNLDDIITIKAYFSKDVPGQVALAQEQVKDILGEYKHYGGSKIQIRIIDPGTDEKRAQEAQMQGIPPIRFNVLRKGKVELTDGYMGIAILYGDKVETLPVIVQQNLSTLEFDLTAGIKKVTSGKDLAVGIAKKENSFISKDRLDFLQQLLSRNYRVEEVDLSDSNLIDEKITTLIVPGPTGELSDRELYVLDQYVMSGRGVIFFVDGVLVDPNLSASPNKSNIFKLLEHYGVTVNKDLVYDPISYGQATFSQGQSLQFSTDYPYWPKIPRSGFSAESVLVNKLESVVLPWVSTISVKGDGYIVLARTSDGAEKKENNFDLAPSGLFFQPVTDNKTGQALPVAVRVSAPLTSMFDKAVALEGDTKAAQSENSIKKVDAARMIVVADANFVEIGFMGRYEDTNAVFVQNLVDGLTLDESLATIRAKSVTDRPIAELDPTARSIVMYGNIFGVPLLVAIFALMKFAWRRKGQRSDNVY
jgi:gliding-associated putative ABC transporter substrate-binding component GldG